VRCCRRSWGFVHCGNNLDHHRGCGHPAETLAEGQLRGSVQDAATAEPAQRIDEGPYLEVPDEAEAESPRPEIEGWEASLNATSFEPSASWRPYWGNSFCTSHHVGYFCQGFTLVRCCRRSWGFVHCGNNLDDHRVCGHHTWSEVAEGESTAQLPEAASAEENAGVYPDETTGFDEPGPYLAVPDESEAENPQLTMAGWDNDTSLQPAAFHSWGRSFCEVHHTGYFCDGLTRVRCCQQRWGFVKCGTTAQSHSCGYHGGAVAGGGSSSGSWVIHSRFRTSSFCRAHHVGFFCYQHSKVHCCTDHGHFVECSTSVERSWRC